MIKKLLIFLCLIILSTFTLFSQKSVGILKENIIDSHIGLGFADGMSCSEIKTDTGFYKKNSIKLVANGFLKGFIGLDYERFLKIHQSVGLRSSLYLYKSVFFIYIPLTDKSRATFNGIKLAPYYRYYFGGDHGNWGYVEGTLLWGYFDFEEISYFSIPYNDPDDKMNFSGSSDSFGFGGSFGWMFKYQHIPLVINLSLGMQYFPLGMPKNKQIEYPNGYIQHYEVDDWFWFFGGPGTIIEFKFMIGGIF